MSRSLRAWSLVLVLAALLFALAACGGTPTAEPAPTVPADGSAGALDGAALVDSLCTGCHNRDRIDAAKKDLAQWQATINRMVTDKGAKVTPEQQSAIAIYLSNR